MATRPCDLFILHLSDLHFGNKSRFSPSEQSATELGKRFFRSVKLAAQELQYARRLDLVIVSGDLAESGKPSEFSQAKEFLEALAGEIGIERQRFVFVPGNHDISWAECKKVDIEIDGEELPHECRREEIDRRKLKAYEAFLKGFYSQSLDSQHHCRALSRNAWLHDYPQLRLSVAALNSCERESHDKGDHVGHVSKDQSQSLLTAWTEKTYDDALKIIVVHHNPTVTTPPNIKAWRKWLLDASSLDEALIDRYEADCIGFDGEQSLKQICDGTLVQLILHGHHHETGRPVGWLTKGGSSAWVLSTGSWGLSETQLPGNEPCSCQLIGISGGQESRAFAHRLIFDPEFWLRGEVDKGHFRSSDSASHNDGLKIDLPRGYQSALRPVKSTPPAVSPQLVAFISEYRARFGGKYESWDLKPVGATQAGGARDAVVARLDDMYLPLRFHSDFDPSKTDLGRIIDIEFLIARQPCRPRQRKRKSTTKRKRGKNTTNPQVIPQMKPIAVRASAGSGKTTWMRHTFRSLLRTDRAFPMMISLRDVAARWTRSEQSGAVRSIDQFLDDAVADAMGSGWEGMVREILNSSKDPLYSGPKPILLVDGWDELGDYGAEFREKLEGLRLNYPELLVVVTSRPYGEERPTNSSGYDEYVIQPLSDLDIQRLARNFFLRCYQLEATVADEEWQKFSAALKRSPEAGALARTALMLTMMLLISRSEPLPDKRHQLYDRSLTNLLTALPQTRAEAGARDLKTQWRPQDSDERRRIVAQLAYDLQNKGYESKARGAIVATWAELSALLKCDWAPEQRYGFIEWLTGPSGVLSDRADGTIVFAHLSFQEYLAAWHIKATSPSSNELAQAYETKQMNTKWWETLLLCGALVAAESQDRIDIVLEKLLTSGRNGQALAGMLFADGIGTAKTFDSWCRQLPESLKLAFTEVDDRCAAAWHATRQATRRAELDQHLIAVAPSLRLFDWTNLNSWRTMAGFGDRTPPPKSKLASSFFKARDVEAIKDDFSLAMGRVHAGYDPLWPRVENINCLNLWPNRRLGIGRRLQIAIEAGASDPDLVALYRVLVQVGSQKLVEERQVVLSTSYFEPLLSSLSNEAMHGSRDFERFATVMQHSFEADYLIDKIVNVNKKDLLFAKLDFRPGKIPSTYLHSIDRNHGIWHLEASSNFGRQRFVSMAEDTGLDTKAEWFQYFLFADALDVRSSLTGIYLSAVEPRSDVEKLLHHACRERFSPGQYAKGFKLANKKQASAQHPLWGPLARIVARHPEEADYQSLLQALEDTSQYSPLFSLALEILVRGDLITERGERITLDSLATQSALDSLPLVERDESRASDRHLNDLRP